MSKEIVLTSRSGDKQYAVVDDVDFEFISQWIWHAAKIVNTTYAQRNEYRDERYLRPHDGYMVRKSETVSMHKVIYYRANPDEAGINRRVTFLDGDSLNCRRNNLSSDKASPTYGSRLMTAKARQGPPRNNKSGFKGVHWDARKNRWVANVRHLGKDHHKTSKSLRDAVIAYNQMAKEVLGANAYQNEVPE